jgi:hypothetical protein
MAGGSIKLVAGSVRRAKHPPVAIVNLYAGIVARGEQYIRARQRVVVSLALDQSGRRHMVVGVEAVVAKSRHGRTGTGRGITPTSSAFTQSHGVAEL